MKNNRFCVSKGAFYLIIILIISILTLGLVNNINKDKQVTSSNASERAVITFPIKLNKPQDVSYLKQNLTFNKFTYNQLKGLLDRNNSYSLLANIIINVQENKYFTSSKDNLNLLNTLYEKYYKTGITPDQAYKDLIAKNFSYVPKTFSDLVSNDDNKCKGFINFLLNLNYCLLRSYCSKLLMVPMPSYCSFNVDFTNPLSIAQHLSQQHAAVYGITLDPKIINIISTAINIYNVASPLIESVTIPTDNSEPAIIGYNLSKLSSNDQGLLVSELVNEAQNLSQPVPIEIEIGHGLQFQPCLTNNLCFKIDLSVMGESSEVQNVVNISGDSGESGMVVWLNGNFNNMTAEFNGAGNGVDRIYTIAPFPGDSDPSNTTNLSPIIRTSYNDLKKGGQFFLFPAKNDFVGDMNKVLQVVPLEEVSWNNLKDLQNNPKFNIYPWIMNPKTHYGIDPRVIIVTRK